MNRFSLFVGLPPVASAVGSVHGPSMWGERHPHTGGYGRRARRSLDKELPSWRTVFPPPCDVNREYGIDGDVRVAVQGREQRGPVGREPVPAVERHSRRRIAVGL